MGILKLVFNISGSKNNLIKSETCDFDCAKDENKDEARTKSSSPKPMKVRYAIPHLSNWYKHQNKFKNALGKKERQCADKNIKVKKELLWVVSEKNYT